MPIEPIAALATLIDATPPAALLRDALVLGHLAAMAVGLGSVIVAEIAMLGHLARPFPPARMDALWRTHRQVGWALVALWATGLPLAALATGADPAEASPKLVAKLATAGGLGLTALAMGRFALPLLAQGEGQALLALPLGRKLGLGLCAGMSMGGWATALLLGAAGTTRTAGAEAVAGVVLLSHGAALGTVLAGVLLGHLWWRHAVPTHLT